MRGKLSWKESFSPHPFQRTLKRGAFLFSNIVRSTVKQLMFAPHQRLKVFARLFQKAAQSRARSPCRSPQRAKSPYPSQNAGVGEFLCIAKEEGEPSSGVRPCFGLLFFTWGKKLSLKRKLSSPTPPSSKKLQRG